MNALKVLLIVLWIVLTGITIYAIQILGSAGGMVFITDFQHPWRAQFNTDFSIHILLFIVWVFWREKSKAIGLVSALLCLMGGLFTLLYLLFAVHQAKGDPKKLLLGTHA
jgi:hypothetical protein